MAFIIEQPIDMRRENEHKVYEQPLEYGDKNAHTWRVVLRDGGKKLDMTGLTATLTFKRAAGPAELEQDPTIRIATVEYPAVVDAANGVAWCTFQKACYGGVGNAVATMKLMDGDTVLTSAVLIMTIVRNTSDAVIDPTNMLPSVDELLAQIGAMKTATNAANEAAQKADKAAEELIGRAPYIGGNGRWYVWNKELGAYADSGVSATGPQGAAGTNGQTPYIGENGNWWIGGVDTGTKAQGPAGQNGTGSGTVTGITIGDATYSPDGTGNVDMSAMVAPDSAKLDGKDSVYFHKKFSHPKNLLDNSDFRSGYFVAQAGIDGMHGNRRYLGDRWINSTSGGATISREGVSVTSADQFQFVEQIVDNLVPGKFYTFALKSRGSSPRRIAVFSSELTRIDAQFEGNAEIIVVSFVAIDFMHAFLLYPAYTEGGGTGVFDWAALYEGEYTVDNLPPYVPKGYANERLACEVYDKGSIFGMDLLWENGSPDSSFAGGTVMNSLSFDGYPYIRVLFKLFTGTNLFGDTGLIEVGNSGRLHYITWSSDVFLGYYRSFDTHAKTFTDCVRMSSTTAIANEACIPYRIYGVKGVL